MFNQTAIAKITQYYSYDTNLNLVPLKLIIHLIIIVDIIKPLRLLSFTSEKFTFAITILIACSFTFKCYFKYYFYQEKYQNCFVKNSYSDIIAYYSDFDYNQFNSMFSSNYFKSVVNRLQDHLRNHFNQQDFQFSVDLQVISGQKIQVLFIFKIMNLIYLLIIELRNIGRN